MSEGGCAIERSPLHIEAFFCEREREIQAVYVHPEASFSLQLDYSQENSHARSETTGLRVAVGTRSAIC